MVGSLILIYKYRRTKLKIELRSIQMKRARQDIVWSLHNIDSRGLGQNNKFHKMLIITSLVTA